MGVSSCLLGEEVRFNGGHKRFRFLTDELGPYVDWVPYCPEIEIGLGTPREPVRLTANGRLVNRSGTADHTLSMNALPLPFAVDGYVFKAKSPSCGVWGIPLRTDLTGRIDAYRRGEVPLSVPVALLAHYASDGGLPWLAEQTYLTPFPAGLRLRHAV